MTNDEGIPRRVLLVEDEANVRRSLERYLSAAGYEVVPVADPDAAFAVLKDRPVDALIVDVRLPKSRSGLEVLQFADLNEGTPQVLRIVLTGVTLSPHEEDIIRRYPAYLFYKPHGYADLVEFLRERLGEPRPDTNV